ncbi:hypothetical protein [Ramlibacter sp. AN1133]|uniref:hypothetical protein n=1 Tax=Ramlibacter sp. AN1133 TaxID=3133429 RepID=UPI0030C341C6
MGLLQGRSVRAACVVDPRMRSWPLDAASPANVPGPCALEQEQLPVDPNDLLILAFVAELGSFGRTAERLGLPKSKPALRPRSQGARRSMMASAASPACGRFQQAHGARGPHVQAANAAATWRVQ